MATGPLETVTILNPELYRTVVEKRLFATQFKSIPEVHKGTARYLGTTRFLIKASPDHVRKRLTEYSKLKSMSQYITTVEHDTKRQLLMVKGRVMNYDFGALLKVEPKRVTGPHQWIRYTPLTEPPTGDRSDVFLEAWNKDSTIVHFETELTVITRWIPDMVISKAYQLVVESIAGRAREKLESEPPPTPDPAPQTKKTGPFPRLKQRGH